jgi:hypothetical protein
LHEDLRLVVSKKSESEPKAMDKPRADMPNSQPIRLRDALREARVETAERTMATSNLHDAEIARLEQLNEAITPLFEEIPPNIELFDRGISRGDTPRLWIDMIAHVVMDRDRRIYRFLQDTRNGPKVLAESASSADIVEAITRYVARRMIERERTLAAVESAPMPVRARSRHKGWRVLRYALFAIVVIIGGVLAAAWIAAGRGL